MNPSVKDRYFSQFDFSPATSSDYFLVSKPPGTLRIFCLGGSTTVGWPYWFNGAFSSFLRDRLKATFPDHSIEVVNVGMTATNSYTVLDLSKDLMKFEPDLIIVYDGHNEFYGALGAASNEHVAPARWMTLLYLRVIHLRTFQLVKNMLSGLVGMFGKAPSDYSSRGTMMEQVSRGKYISYGSDTYARALAVFRQNLRDLADLCRNRHILLFLGTQVSDFREQSPFISGNSPGLSHERRAEFQRVFNTGVELQSKGLLDSAIVVFRSAIALDSLYADAHYRLAQCFDVKGRKREAYPEYILARNYDELRFRTDSKFNNLIRSMEDDKDCFVADVEASFEALSPDSLIGHNLILEHLHPNARGQFLIAKEYARLMRDHGLLASTEEWTKRDTLTDDFLWEHRHLTDMDELIAARRVELLTSGWPFKDQNSAVALIEDTDTLQSVAQQAIHGQISWGAAHERAAQYYMQHGDSMHAENEYETIINQLPLEVGPYLRLAHLYFNQKAFSKAEAVLVTSLEVEQTPVADRVLGDICMKQGKIENAVHYYEELRKFPEDPSTAPENAYVLALTYLVTDRPEQAIQILEQTVDRYPSYAPARALLSRVMQSGNPAPAR